MNTNPKRNIDAEDYSSQVLDKSNFSNTSSLLSGTNQPVTFEGASLQSASFENAELPEANFTQANLTGANCRGANFNNANFTDVEAGDADFTDASLKGINYDNYDYELNNTIFERANLEKAELIIYEMNNVNFRAANLSHAHLGGEERLQWNNINAEEATLDYCTWGAFSYFEKCNFRNAKMRHLEFHPHGTSENSDFTGTDFRYSRLSAFDARQCAGADFRCAAFAMSSFKNADLRGARFAGAMLTGTDLTGANLTDASWEEVIDGVKRTALLPDKSWWTSQTDMGRFTDINHPDYSATQMKVKMLESWDLPEEDEEWWDTLEAEESPDDFFIAAAKQGMNSAGLQERAKAYATLGLYKADERPGIGAKWYDSLTGEKLYLPEILWGKDVPAGSYQIGGDSPAAYKSLPATQWAINYNYRLSKYPVTMAQYQVFIDDKTSGFSSEAWWHDFPENIQEHALLEQVYRYWNHPRDNVSMYQALAFCRWLSAKFHAAGLLAQDWEIRLPSQEEWEIAARYPDGRLFPHGNHPDMDVINAHEAHIGQTSAVGIIPKGRNVALDLYDMGGNVWEWTLTKKRDEAREKDNYIVKGGAFNASTSWHCRGASRVMYSPFTRNMKTGFRLCAAPKNVLQA